PAAGLLSDSQRRGDTRCFPAATPRSLRYVKINHSAFGARRSGHRSPHADGQVWSPGAVVHHGPIRDLRPHRRDHRPHRAAEPAGASAHRLATRSVPVRHGHDHGGAPRGDGAQARPERSDVTRVTDSHSNPPPGRPDDPLAAFPRAPVHGSDRADQPLARSARPSEPAVEAPSVEQAIMLREQAPELYDLWLKIAQEKAATANYVDRAPYEVPERLAQSGRPRALGALIIVLSFCG